MYFLANPRRFARIYPYLLASFVVLTILGLTVGLVLGLGFSPPAERHGEMVRMLYIHPQSAILGLLCWAAMSVSAGVGFVMRHPLADIATQAIALPGLLFTFLSLATGYIWSVPGFGGLPFADPMIILVQVLLLLYVTYFALVHAFEDPIIARRFAGFLAMLGLLVVLLVHYTPDLFNTIHQEKGISSRAIQGDLYVPFIAMLIGFVGLAGTSTLMRMKILVAEMKVRAAMLRTTAARPEELKI